MRSSDTRTPRIIRVIPKKIANHAFLKKVRSKNAEQCPDVIKKGLNIERK